jgi:hypothetical protein
VVTWEWHAGIRSWLLPGAFALIMRATAGLASGPYGYLSSITVIMTLLSLSVVIVGGAALRHHGRADHRRPMRHLV